MEQLLLKLKGLLGNSTFDELVVSREVIDLKAICDVLLQKGTISKDFYKQIANVFEK
ncbi:hypothetical protein [Thermaerobacillus caldiproteolyticus]|uniref:hypothetical protein n=1 Tax=Thermaerobacillus caldiproteolyticus TaxID=247480 RepID=UPI00188A0335|nr:hypothetical protein [Anoxybacillus caldiproteolyticus]QPA33381.1 hypothetical protein ISX45_19210 [Anoxybacillus caldiproteolyticus]